VTEFLGLNISRVPLPEEYGLELLPDLRVPPMLGEDISWVDGARDVIETDNPCGDDFAYSVERQYVVALVELRMNLHRTVDDRFVVAKHVGLATNRDS
jgi:hypothetical protein